ncbi:hypothetical protein QR685DRAFT_510215 [Neurospora intermedia]|uniref:Uncharacterized protein n=1 Tax=Neurospora intermedia TaxID=5142 RepID=A0ABR3DPJ0_NEUIN
MPKHWILRVDGLRRSKKDYPYIPSQRGDSLRITLEFERSQKDCILSVSSCNNFRSRPAIESFFLLGRRNYCQSLNSMFEASQQDIRTEVRWAGVVSQGLSHKHMTAVHKRGAFLCGGV